MKSASFHSIDYSRDLNPAQLEAVTAAGGPVLVIAGAGSGKTRTIVYRVAWLVEHGVAPSSILLLTFTRKAAEEMLTRAALLVQGSLAQVTGGTFHSTGNLLLRRYANRLGLQTSFSIMDQSDSIDAFDHLRKSIAGPVTDLKSFPRARTIAEVVSRSKGTQTSIRDSLEYRYPHFVHAGELIEKIGAEYEEYKRLNNLIDYDDLLLHTIRLLEEYEDVRRDVSARWQHVLVDEYQDTNRLQARMLVLLASDHGNVMAVGDDSQSIYAFRGADFRNIMEFPDLFPGTRIIKLEENYRSTAPILAVTNSIIERASVGYPKRLYTRRAGGPLPLAARPMDERRQSRFVVQCVKELVEHDIPIREVAVLFRAGYHSFDLEAELARNSIPFVKYGGFKFIESVHIKDVLAHLRVVANPADRLSWTRILKLLPGVGVKTAMKLADRIAGTGIPNDAAELFPRSGKHHQEIQKLLDLVRRLKQTDEPLANKVDQVNQYYYPHLMENYDNYPKRMKDLEHLTDLTVRYRSLYRFLNDMALEPPDEERTGNDRRSNSLVLSTIHSAKGLEWHTVILIWAAEGRIPSPMAMDSPDELEEERRLLYVAATRAKHNLVILAPRTMMDRARGISQVRPSRFIEEIPQEYFRGLALD
ncbi:MAG: ATP-dependent helicase [Desulfomonile sp.]|nr:ATP-dependent helicase [Desulfomonile sp.]